MTCDGKWGGLGAGSKSLKDVGKKMQLSFSEQIYIKAKIKLDQLTSPKNKI